MRYELILDTLIDDNLKLYAPEPCNNNIITGYWVSNLQYHVLKGKINKPIFIFVRCSTNASFQHGLSVHIYISIEHLSINCRGN